MEEKKSSLSLSASLFSLTAYLLLVRIADFNLCTVSLMSPISALLNKAGSITLPLIMMLCVVLVSHCSKKNTVWGSIGSLTKRSLAITWGRSFFRGAHVLERWWKVPSSFTLPQSIRIEIRNCWANELNTAQSNMADNWYRSAYAH